jgi:hypothetical protein
VSGANGDLLGAAGGAREQQAGDVNAGQQQDKTHRAEEDRHRRAHIFRQGCAKRLHLHAPTGVGGRILLLQPPRNGAHVALRLLH